MHSFLTHECPQSFLLRHRLLIEDFALLVCRVVYCVACLLAMRGKSKLHQSQTAPGRQSSTRAITSKQHPKTAPAAAPQTACPLHPAVNLARMRLHRNPKSTPNSQTPSRTPNSVPKRHLRQHPKLHAPLHPTVKMQKCACTVTCMDSTRA